jgi:peptidyl-prolyl cis-trans isomerase SurA
MHKKIKNLKFTHLSSLLFALVITTSIQAQINVLQDTTVTEQNLQIQKDSIKPFKKFRAEGVAAVVGEYVILDSDIDKSYLELQQQGISVEGVSRCQLLGKLMEDKLYAHQAKIDSLLVPDEQINAKIDQQIQYMVSQLGTEEKVAQFYRKDNIQEVRNELFEVNKTVALASQMQSKIIESVEITPEEVRTFFYSIPEDQRPIFASEVEVAQLVIEPEITKEAKQNVIDRLNVLRSDVIDNGASFATKAVLYSKDPGSASKGGLIEGITRDAPFAKEFKDQAFSLLEGEVSEPFETQFGFHILYVEKIRGQAVDVRHILLFPEVSEESVKQARAKIDSVRTKIVNGEITFSDAAKRYSTDKETRTNGGQLVNPVTLDTRFDLTKMDPELGAQVYNLKQGEVSQVFSERDYAGRMKFKILTVTKRYDEHPADFIKDYEKIKELALKQKQIKAIEEWQNKTIENTSIQVNNEYRDCDFASNWLKKENN